MSFRPRGSGSRSRRVRGEEAARPRPAARRARASTRGRAAAGRPVACASASAGRSARPTGRPSGGRSARPRRRETRSWTGPAGSWASASQRVTNSRVQMRHGRCRGSPAWSSFAAAWPPSRQLVSALRAKAAQASWASCTAKPRLAAIRAVVETQCGVVSPQITSAGDPGGAQMRLQTGADEGGVHGFLEHRLAALRRHLGLETGRAGAAGPSGLPRLDATDGGHERPARPPLRQCASSRPRFPRRRGLLRAPQYGLVKPRLDVDQQERARRS